MKFKNAFSRGEFSSIFGLPKSTFLCTFLNSFSFSYLFIIIFRFYRKLYVYFFVKHRAVFFLSLSLFGNSTTWEDNHFFKVNDNVFIYILYILYFKPSWNMLRCPMRKIRQKELGELENFRVQQKNKLRKIASGKFLVYSRF